MPEEGFLLIMDGQVLDHTGRLRGELTKRLADVLEASVVEGSLYGEGLLNVGVEAEGARDSAANSALNRVFERWRELTGRRVRLTPERRKKLKARLKEMGEEDVMQAVENVMADQWFVENNHTDLQMICRSQEATERYRDMRPRRNGGSPLTSTAGREAAMRKLEDGAAERAWADKVAALCWQVNQPPSEPDKEWGMPGNDPAKARKELQDLGLDDAKVLATFAAYWRQGHVQRYGVMDTDVKLKFVAEATGRTTE